MSSVALPSRITRAVPPVALPEKTKRPPAPPSVPPLAVSVARAAVALPANSVRPPGAPSLAPPRLLRLDIGSGGIIQEGGASPGGAHRSDVGAAVGDVGRAGRWCGRGRRQFRRPGRSRLAGR